MKEGGKNIDFNQEVMKFMKKGNDFSWEVMKFMKKGSDFSREVLKFMKKGNEFSREVLKFTKKVVERLGVLDMVVGKCLFCEVFLKVVFKKHVNYNEQIDVRNIRKKQKKQLIAFELYSLEKLV